MEKKFKFKVSKETIEEVDVEVDYGIHYFVWNQSYYRINIQPHKIPKQPIVDILKVEYEKGLDTLIVYSENEFDIPYRYTMFLAGQGDGKTITIEDFNEYFNRALLNIAGGLLTNQV